MYDFTHDAPRAGRRPGDRSSSRSLKNRQKKMNPAQHRDNQKIRDAFRVEHEIVQCINGVSHDFFSGSLSAIKEKRFTAHG
jgi:hypothetical protein